MLITEKNKTQILISVFFCEIALISCNPQPQLISSSSDPTSIATEASVASASSQHPILIDVTDQSDPTVQYTLTYTPVQTTTIPSTQVTTPIEPTIIKSIMVSDMPYHPGGGSGTMLALPGQIWTGTLFSGLQQWDPQTGDLVMTISEIEENNFFDIECENNRLWVLASIDDSNQAEVLYVIELPQGEIVKKIPITDEGDYGTAPTQLGNSPGKIWVNFGLVDTETFEYISFPDGLPSDAHFIYDDEKWMWITGSWCDGCRHDLWLVNAIDPSEKKDSKNSGPLDTGVLGQPLVLANGKVWLVAHYYSANDTYFLDGYDIHKTDLPEFHTDVTSEVQGYGNINIAADEHMVWIEVEGTIYYFDSKNGQKIGELKVGENADSIGFDGTSLWVLCSDAGLLQISLPWIP